MAEGKVLMDEEGVKVCEFKVSGEEGLNQFINDADYFLGDYTDPREELREAILDADRTGYLLEAVKDGKRVGIAILLKMRFETFFPKYHLSHIGVSPDARGQGIGDKLFRTCYDLAEGNMSLHVETDNKKAIELYKKYGLKVHYYRMDTMEETRGSD
jgi:threonine synthase